MITTSPIKVEALVLDELQDGVYKKVLATTVNETGLVTQVGIVTSGTWQATPVDGQYINYNTTNLRVTSNQLNTIQDIATTSSPTFSTITANTRLQGNVATNYESTIGNITVYPGGYLEYVPFNFRFDQNVLQFCNRRPSSDGITITKSGFTDNEVDILFSQYTSAIDLYGRAEGSYIEVTTSGNIMGDAPTYPFVLLHSNNNPVTCKFEIRWSGGGGTWTDLGTFNFLNHRAPYIDGSGGSGYINGVRWTFTNILSPTYVRWLGFLVSRGEGYSWTVKKYGDSIYGNLKLLNSAYLGIGTSSPTYPLDVRGNVGLLNETNHTYLYIKGNTGYTGNLFVNANADNNQFQIHTNDASTYVTGQKGIQFRATTGDYTFSTGAGNTERFKIDSNGNIIFGTITANNTGRITTSSGNLELYSTGDILLNPTGKDILPVSAYDLNIGSITKKYLTLHAAELWVTNLVAQNTLATIGGRILVGQTTTLIADCGSGATSIDVKHHLTLNDIVVLESDGKLEFMQITSSGTPITGGYRFSVTRNLDGTGANDWYSGDAVFNTGQVGEGWIDIYSVNGLGNSDSGPTIVGNVRTALTYNSYVEHWAIGNLNGLYGYAVDTYGAGLGKYSTTDTYITIDTTNGFRIHSNNTVKGVWNTSGIVIGDSGTTKSYVTIDASGNLYLQTTGVSEVVYTRLQLLNDGSGYLANSNISWTAAGVITIGGWTIDTNRLYTTNVELSSSGQYFRMGSTLPSYDSGTGIWMGLNSAAYKVFIGNSAGNKFLWDGTNLSISGQINATSGLIGGWDISTNKIYKTIYSAGAAVEMYVTGNGSSDIGGVFVKRPDGALPMVSGIYTKGSSAKTDIVFFAGSAGEVYDPPTTVPFYVTAAGYLKSSSGEIGGWNIADGSLNDGSSIYLMSKSCPAPAAGVIYIAGCAIDLGLGIGMTGTGDGTISLGTGGTKLTLSGTGTGIITGGTIRTASSGSRIELSGANNSIDIYNTYTLSRIRYDDYGLIIDDDVNNTYTSYQQYFKLSNNGLNVYKRQSDAGWINVNFGKVVENSNGSIVRVWKENITHSYIAESFSIARTALTTGWTIQWGTDTTDPDTNLYRSAASTLKTDDNFIVDLALTVNGNTTLGNTNTDQTTVRGALYIGDGENVDGIQFGTSGGTYDTNLYRSAANTLKTDDNFSALTLDAGSTVSSYDILKIRNTAEASNSNYAGISFYLQDDAPGEVLYGRMYVVSTSSVTPDDEGTFYIALNNYGSMTTGLTLTASGGLSIASTVTSPYIIGTTQVRAKSSDTSASTPGFSWNDDSDTGFFKPASNTIGVVVGNSEKFRFDSNGRLNVTTNVAGPTSNTYGLTLGGASAGSPDTYLYRSAASTLRTNSNLVVDGTLSVNGTAVTGKSYVLQGGAAMLVPANATNYYWGAHPATTPWTYPTPGKIYIPKNGTLKYILVSVYHTNITWSVLAESSWIMYYRYNNGSSVQIESRTSQNTNYYSYWTASGLSLSVTAGSYIEIHELTPTFSTSPSNCYRAVVMYIE